MKSFCLFISVKYCSFHSHYILKQFELLNYSKNDRLQGIKVHPI